VTTLLRRRQHFVWPVELWAFIAFFPGFIVYQTFIVQGFASPIFGGLSTPTALFFLPTLMMSMVWRLSRGQVRLGALDWVFFAYVTGFLLFALIGYVTMKTSMTPVVHIATALQLISYYLCIRQITYKDKRSKTVFIFAFFIAIITIFLFKDSVVLSYGNEQLDSIFYRDYQGYALCLVVITFSLLSTTNKVSTRISVYILALAALFINGARSEVIAVIPAFALNEILVSKQKSLGFIGIVLALSIAAVILPYLQNVGEAGRIFQLVSDYQGDASFNERIWTNQNAIQTIQEHPITGKYASYPDGLYAHSVLSVWVDLGLLGFFVYACLILAPLINLWRRGIFNADRGVVAAAAMGLTMLFLAVAAKGHTYKLLAPAVAMAAAVATRPNDRGSAPMNKVA
jgi:O-antigen ligase